MNIVSDFQPIPDKTSLIGYDLPSLEELVISMDEPRFRANQLHSWIYVKNRRHFSEMTNLAKSFRNKLYERFTIGSLEIADKHYSSDGTIKYLFNLPDGEKIESVLMHFEERDVYALCLSTQAGCAVGCNFCATGGMGFRRNLSVSEIIEQLLFVRYDTSVNIRNIVFMGQGEPLLNYENLLKSLRIINQSAEIGMRHITVSTSGIVPMIDKLAEEKLQLTLAVSLHASNNETRSLIMPINRKYPIETLIPALHRYVEKTGRRITIEYMLLADINDSQHDAQRLIDVLKGLHCNINLIPYNPVDYKDEYKRPSRNQIDLFKDWLMPTHHKVTVRLERGTDIAAACGQLQNKQVAISNQYHLPIAQS